MRKESDKKVNISINKCFINWAETGVFLHIYNSCFSPPPSLTFLTSFEDSSPACVKWELTLATHRFATSLLVSR